MLAGIWFDLCSYTGVAMVAVLATAFLAIVISRGMADREPITLAGTPLEQTNDCLNLGNRYDIVAGVFGHGVERFSEVRLIGVSARNPELAEQADGAWLVCEKADGQKVHINQQFIVAIEEIAASNNTAVSE